MSHVSRWILAFHHDQNRPDWARSTTHDPPLWFPSVPPRSTKSDGQDRRFRRSLGRFIKERCLELSAESQGPIGCSNHLRLHPAAAEGKLT